MFGGGGRKTVEFALEIQRRLARRCSAQTLKELIARADCASQLGQRRPRLDRDPAPAREIERKRDVIVNRVPRPDIDVEAVRNVAETAPEMEIPEARRIAEWRGEARGIFLAL